MMKTKRLSEIQKSILVLLLFGSLTQACGQPPNQVSNQQDVGSMTPVEGESGDSEYFEEVSTPKQLEPDDDTKPYRTRQVIVKISALREKLKRSVASNVRLGVFPDKNLDVFVENVETISAKNIIVTGHVQGQEESAVTIAINEDVFLANIQPNDGPRYSVQYIGEGAHSISEVENVGKENDCMTEEVSETANLEPDHSEEETLGQQDAMAIAATPVIDMLVAYTPGARSKKGGTAAMKALIQMGIADTNKAFANSGVKLKVRLAGTMELRQNDRNNYSGDLDRLKRKTDGMWDEVHARRAQLGADQVTVVGTYTGNGVAGIGYIKAVSSKAFTIVKVSSFDQYSFSHELGHNVGLNHTDGFQNTTGKFRTVMAYGYYRRIPRFSNPNLTYQNYRTGTSSKNSASILNRYGKNTASFASLLMSATSTDHELHND